MSAAFDTLAAAEALEYAGATPELAKAHAAQLRSAAEAARGDLAARADLAELKAELKADLHTLNWRLLGLVIAANALLVAAVKLIP